MASSIVYRKRTNFSESDDLEMKPAAYELSRMLEYAEVDSDYWMRIFAEFRINKVQELLDLRKSEDQLHLLVGRGRDEKEKRQVNNLIMICCSLNEYGLAKYFPDKLTYDQVMKLSNVSGEQPFCINYLRKLIEMDYTIRDKLCNCTDTNTYDANNPSCCHEIHPADFFLMLYQCSDILLKQLIVLQFFKSRMAVPIFYPLLGKCNCFEIMMWPLRCIVPEWRDKYGKLVQTDLASTNANIVSFGRLGESQIYSKSQCINDLLSERSHNTFFHREVENGHLDREFCNGMIEASWYFPSNESSQATKPSIFQKMNMILNLRGDCLSQETLAGLHFLLSLSSVFILIVNLEGSIEKIRETIQKVLDNECRLIIILRADASTDRKNIPSVTLKLRELFESDIDIIEYHGKKNAKLIEQELKRKLNTHIMGKEWTKAANASTLPGLIVDEHNKLFEEGRRKAQSVHDCIGELAPSVIKEQEFKLQGDLLKQFSTKLREKTNPSRFGQRNALRRIDSINTDLERIRIEQVTGGLAQGESHIMHIFVNCLVMSDTKTQWLFLQQLKLHLDTLSRETMVPLQERFREAIENYRQKKGAIASLQTAIRAAAIDLENNNFGLEHFFRELGQMYESVTFIESKASPLDALNTKLKMLPQMASRVYEAMSSDKSRAKHAKDARLFSNIKKLPEVVSSLVLAGHPIELLNTDAHYVPTVWLDALFSQMYRQVGDKRVLFISILGKQSSGKSTLLNTMFGAQFPVSAGRCTRGIFMQLVEVARTTQLPIDYVGILDTEGLHAAEGEKDFETDLCTFVIGLSDVTIVNVKGENYDDLKDTMEKAVKAFYRLKLVSGSNRKHRCIFAHQNTSAVDAKEKLKEQSHKLEAILDELTQKEAKHQLDGSTVHFQDMISFSGDDDVFFFNDLWSDEPPMGISNPSYGQQVHKLRQNILTHEMLKHSCLLLLNDISSQIRDLWEALLSKDFVCFYRDTREIKGYFLFEEMYTKICVEVQKELLFWRYGIAEPKIMHNEGVELDQAVLELKHNIRTQENALRSKHLETISNLCNGEAYGGILEQYEDTFGTLLSNEITNKINAAEDSIKMFRNLKGKNTEKWRDGHKEHVLSEVCQNAARILWEPNKLSEKEIRKRYYSIWPNCICDKAYEKLFQQRIVYYILECQYVKSTDIQYAINEIELSFYNPEGPDDIVSIITEANVNFYYQINFQSKALFQLHSSEEIIAIYIKSKVLPIMNNYAKKLPMKEKFQISRIDELLEQITSKMDGVVHHSGLKFTFLPPLKARIILHMFKSISPKLWEMNQRHLFYDYFEIFWHVFKHITRGMCDDITLANIYCEAITSKLRSLMKQRLPSIWTLTVLETYPSKLSILPAILSDICKKRSFDDFQSYIENPHLFAVSWLQEQFEKHLKKHSGSINLYQVPEALLSKELDALLEWLQKADMSDSTKWQTNMETFLTQRFGLTMITDMLAAISDKVKKHVKVTDVKLLKRTITESCKNIKISLLKEFKEHTISLDKDSYNKIGTEIWGCQEVCPYCGETCVFSVVNHPVQHRCLQHRPQAFKPGAKEFELNTCNFAVYHKEIILGNDWDIAPARDCESSVYWCWATAKFSQKLSELFELDTPDIPRSWKQISELEATESVKPPHIDKLTMNKILAKIAARFRVLFHKDL